MRLSYLSTVVLLASLCAYSSTAPPTDPELTQRAKHVVVYDGPEIKAHLEYWWADDYVSKTYLMLKLGLMVDGTQSTEVRRDAIWVETPDGRTVTLIDPKEFQRLYPDLLSALNLNNAWAPPPKSFTNTRTSCDRWFLSRPGNFRDFPSLTIVHGHWCSGPLIFDVPEGVRTGQWALIIGLEEGDVRIPFTLGE